MTEINVTNTTCIAKLKLLLIFR
ncbi:hypothetical protein O9993_23085 [Vibrio lentus]|nr:hypothetical protein [Vibrio lentus]